MKAFYYSPYHVGMDKFPPGYFKLEGFKLTEDPGAADCFVLPCDLRHVSNSQLLALPYAAQHPFRHVFFTLSEFPSRALPFDAISFRTDFNRTLQQQNPRSQSWCWGVEDLIAYTIEPEEDKFLFDIHAQMWASSPITDAAVESCSKVKLKVHDQRNEFFYGTLETAQDPRLGQLRESFLKTMRHSRLVLVPRSRAGVNRYRFYEAMSMGRIPVLLCDDCILPCDSKIDYELCCIRIPERLAVHTGEILKTWLEDISEAQQRLMRQTARGAWEQWLAPTVWEHTWGILTEEELRSIRVSG